MILWSMILICFNSGQVVFVSKLIFQTVIGIYEVCFNDFEISQ